MWPFLTETSAKIVYVKGRQHPVKIYHSAESQLDYTDAAMRTFFQIHTDQPPGDVLIFLPGQEDIESLQKSIQLLANQLPSDKPSVSHSLHAVDLSNRARSLHVRCMPLKTTHKIAKPLIRHRPTPGSVYWLPTLPKHQLQFRASST